MAKFKVGDRVKRVAGGNRMGVLQGGVYTVSEVSSGGSLLIVGKGETLYDPDCFKLVQQGVEPMENPSEAKYGVNWMEDEDSTEFFGTEKAAKAKIEQLLKDDNVDKDSIYLFEVSNVRKVHRPVTFELVNVVKRAVKRATKRSK